jgi:hypothetical protein
VADTISYEAWRVNAVYDTYKKHSHRFIWAGESVPENSSLSVALPPLQFCQTPKLQRLVQACMRVGDHFLFLEPRVAEFDRQTQVVRVLPIRNSSSTPADHTRTSPSDTSATSDEEVSKGQSSTLEA